VNLGAAKVCDRLVGGWLGRLIGLCDRLREIGRVPPPVEDVRRILVVKFWGLGNWALLRPIVHDLRCRWPGAELTIVTLAANAPLCRDLCDRLLTVRADSIRHTLIDLARGVTALRRRAPDLALDFEQFSQAGALLARLGRAAQRIGFRAGKPGRDGLYTVLVPFCDDAHAGRSFRDLAEAAGLEPGPYVPGHLTPTAAGASETRVLRARAPYVVLHPGSGDNFTGRRWSEAGFGALGRAARVAGRAVYVTGGPAERELAARVAGAVGDGATSLAGGLTVAGLVALLGDAEVLASNDTGPVHLASALGVPVLAFFGPNTPVLYGPLSAGSHAFYRALPCSPCITVANYRSSRCRIHTCMASIPTGAAVEVLNRLMQRRGHRAGAV
jgi:ADP-heptose:LPS heptosyltransferase